MLHMRDAKNSVDDGGNDHEYADVDDEAVEDVASPSGAFGAVLWGQKPGHLIDALDVWASP